MKTKIIAISGKKQSGKDTTAKILQFLAYVDKLHAQAKAQGESIELPSYHEFLELNDAVKQPIQVKKFAGKLKNIVAELLSCNVNDLESEDFKNSKIDYLSSEDKIITPRYLLQYLGTDVLRNSIHEDIHVNMLLNELKSSQNANTLAFIITDLRFPNELDAIKQLGGVAIRINRNEVNKVVSTSLHESETALDNAEFDCTIDNNGTFEELFFKVQKLYEMLQKQSRTNTLYNKTISAQHESI